MSLLRISNARYYLIDRKLLCKSFARSLKSAQYQRHNRFPDLINILSEESSIVFQIHAEQFRGLITILCSLTKYDLKWESSKISTNLLASQIGVFVVLAARTSSHLHTFVHFPPLHLTRKLAENVLALACNWLLHTIAYFGIFFVFDRMEDTHH